MIVFDYQLSPSWNKTIASSDLSTLGATELRYCALLGDIIMIAGEHDFSARWGWIPIVDFVASLRQIVGELVEADSVESEFEFTESSASIRFKRSGKIVLVTADYVDCETKVSLEDLRKAVDDFAEKVAREFCQQFPSLLSNQIFLDLLRPGDREK